MSNPEQPLVNRVAESGLITINLEKYFPAEPIIGFDLKDYLFQGLILREKEFRDQLKDTNWAAFGGKHLAVFCSTDAIIPVWAYMLVAVLASPHVKTVRQATPEQLMTQLFDEAIHGLDLMKYQGQRVVIKGCSDKPVPPSAYLTLTNSLIPFAQSIMYGEPCSTVPLFKRPRVITRPD